MTTQVVDPRIIAAARRRLTMLFDGGFLLLAGVTQVTLELVAHHLGRDPLGDTFVGSPYTIGWVEAHGLAGLIGLGFVIMGGRDGRRFWRGAALARVLLGTANVVFWSSFVAFGTRPLGMAATVVHLAFVVAQLACLASLRTAARR